MSSILNFSVLQKITAEQSNFFALLILFSFPVDASKGIYVSLSYIKLMTKSWQNESLR